MFNNPFDSFHNTVAEAKEEREQLDRLLTISTPRERLLVGAIALLLTILVAWLLFGTVTRSLAVSGVLVEPGENARAHRVVPEGGRSQQAIVVVQPDVAPLIKTGMPAAVELAMTDARVVRLDGVIATIVPEPLFEGLPESATSRWVYRVELALDEGLETTSPAGMVRIVIDLGRQSPIELLGTGRS